MILLVCILNQEGNTLKYLSYVLILILVTVIVFIAISYFNRIRYTSETFIQTNKPLQNPYCGFYHIIGYTLSDDYESSDSYTTAIGSYTESLVLLEINLKNYRTGEISEKGLKQLNDILASWEKSPNNTKLILRFLYDWDGMALATEPDSIDIILKHMEQISQSINKYRDTVYIMQGVFIGNWGEMHHSKFQDESSLKQLFEKLNNVIDSSIYLSVRTPKQWRDINRSAKANNTRIGLFNDGILGSESDLGTYSENEREKELKFQNELCRYVPNGGEVVFNNNLSELKTSVSSLKEMHISYLNADYDSRVLEKWKGTVWQGDDPFRGCDGYTYIKSHLGYRFVLDSCKIKQSGIIRPDYTLQITIENSGFSKALKPFKTDIILLNEGTDECMSVLFDADLRTVESGNKKTFTATLPVKVLKQEDYLIYLSVKDKSSGQTILLGNENGITENGYLLGRLKK